MFSPQILSDLEYSACFIMDNTFRGTDSEFCAGPNRKVMQPILAGLPLLWRFLQQIKRYNDSKEVNNLNYV